jgi:pimeloyl-ACP methyl ester carboxylesterase
MWAPIQRELALLGRRSLAVDLPGHGFDSQYSAAYQAPQDLDARAAEPSTLAGITLQDNVDMVVDVARRVAEHGPVVLVGASLGGTTITGVGNTVPDLVDRLVCISAWSCVQRPNPDVVTRLIEAGHWREGDPPILVIFDAGYDVTRLAHLLGDLPVDLLGRLRSDRAMRLPAPPRLLGSVGRPRKRGGELALADPATWPVPQVTTTTCTSRYGTAIAAAWDRVHPRLTHRSAWLDHDSDLPVIDGTLIRLRVDHLPGDREPKPVWLWSSATSLPAAEVDRLWQAFLRRFDLETSKPQCCHSRGWLALLRAPSCSLPVSAA